MYAYEWNKYLPSWSSLQLLLAGQELHWDRCRRDYLCVASPSIPGDPTTLYWASRYPCQFGLACSLLQLRLPAASFVRGQPFSFVVWACLWHLQLSSIISEWFFFDSLACPWCSQGACRDQFLWVSNWGCHPSKCTFLGQTCYWSMRLCMMSKL